MIPVIFFLPVFGSSLGYVCFMPTHIVLHILSIVLLLLLTPVLLLNVIDSGEINLGFWAMHSFILGTLLFIALASFGIRKFSAGLISASLFFWFITYGGFLMLSIYSIWTPKSVEATSINGRCVMNLWLFDWCCKARGIHCESDQANAVVCIKEASKNVNYFYTNGNLLDMPTFGENKKSQSVNQSSIRLSQSYLRNQIPELNETIPDRKFYFNNKIQGSRISEQNKTNYNADSNDKTIMSDHKKSLLALLATLASMLIIISLYTLYAVALNDILCVLRYPFPVVFIATEPSRQAPGTSAKEQQTPQAVSK